MSLLYSTDAAAQKIVMENLESRIAILTSSLEPVILTQLAEPRQREWEAAYLALDGANTLPIPIEVELYWNDTTQVRGMYSTVDDLVTILPNGKLTTGGAWFDGNHNVIGALDSKYWLIGGDKGVNAPANEITAWTPYAAFPYVLNEDGSAIAYRSGAVVFVVNRAGVSIGSFGLPVMPFAYVGGYLYYQTSPTTAGESDIKRIRDDGSGAITLTTRSSGNPSCASAVAPLYFDAPRNRLYFSAKPTSSCAATILEIWYVSFTGTGQTNSGFTTAQLAFGVTSENGNYVISNFTAVFDLVNLAFLTNTEPTPLTRRLLAEGFPATSLGDAFGTTPIVIRRRSANNKLAIYSTDTDTTGVGRLNFLVANEYSGHFSTGRVYSITPWADSFDDFKQIAALTITDVTQETNEWSVTLPSAYEHILIVARNVSAKLLSVTFNDDTVLTNYKSVGAGGYDPTVSFTNPAGSVPGFFINDIASSILGNSSVVLVPGINGTANKVALTINTDINVYDSSSSRNLWGVGGIWNNNQALTKLTFGRGLLGNLLTGTKIRVYGLRGTGRYNIP